MNAVLVRTVQNLEAGELAGANILTPPPPPGPPPSDLLEEVMSSLKLLDMVRLWLVGVASTAISWTTPPSGEGEEPSPKDIELFIESVKWRGFFSLANAHLEQKCLCRQGTSRFC